MSLNSVKGKTYGLIIPNKKPATEPVRPKPAANVFGEESDEEDAEFKQPNFDVKMETIKASLRKTTKVNIEKALEEDASVFQYDEVYDEITREKDQKLLEKSMPAARKPKYVNKLLKASAARKLERELLTERKAQRELEEERAAHGEAKEAFVTGAYKAKMAELRELVEQRRAEEEREAVMDVTKQDGLGGFYRYMFQQRTAEKEPKGGDSTASEGRSPSPPSRNEAQEDHVRPERPSTSRHRSPSPSRRDHSYDKSRNDRPSNSRRRSPDASPHRRRYNDKARDSRTARRSDDGHSSTSSRHRRRDDDDSRGRRSHYDRDHHSSRGTGYTSGHRDDSRRRRDECERNSRRDRDTAESSKTDKLEDKKGTESKKERTPPPRGFIHAKPRKTTEDELKAARERYLARREAGLTRPVIVESDDEA